MYLGGKMQDIRITGPDGNVVPVIIAGVFDNIHVNVNSECE